MRRALPILLLLGAFALGACGGDDNKSSDNASTTATTGATTTGTTKGTTSSGTTQETTTTKDRRRGHKGGGGDRKRSGGGGGSKTTTTNKTQSTTQTPPASTTPSQIPKPYDTAKKVCGAFLPLAITRAVDKGRRSAKSVARQYSRAWPKDQKTAAYKGCLAGLKARKGPTKKK
jgi:hypothetical protein